MPEGSSSAAPVISPGPRSWKNSRTTRLVFLELVIRSKISQNRHYGRLSLRFCYSAISVSPDLKICGKNLSSKPQTDHIARINIHDDLLAFASCDRNLSQADRSVQGILCKYQYF